MFFFLYLYPYNEYMDLNQPFEHSSVPGSKIRNHQNTPHLQDSVLKVKCVFDEKGEFVQVDDACLELLGFTPEELMGRRFMDLVTEEDRELTGDVAIQIMNGAVVDSFENHYYCKDGSQKRILWSARWDFEQKLMYCTAQDSNHLHSLSKPDESFQRLYRAYRLAQIGWWEWDIREQCFYLSDEIYLIYGLSKSEFPSLSRAKFLDLVHPEDRRSVDAELDIMTTLPNFQFEHRMVKPGGELYHMIHYVQTEYNASMEIVRVHGTAKNITERTKAAMELADEQRRTQLYADHLTNIMESIDKCFFACNSEWNFTFCNQKALTAFNKKREELIGTSVWNIFDENVGVQMREGMKWCMKEKQTMAMENFSEWRNTWYEVSISPTHEGIAVYFNDINERKKKEQELKISNERYEFVSHATSDVIWDMDLVKMELRLNESFTAAFGHPVSEETVVNHVWMENLHAQDRDRVRERQFATLNDASQHHWEDQYRFRRADGTYAYVKDRAIIIRNGEGEAIRMIGAVKDITREKEAELAMARNEKRFRAMVQSGSDLIALFDGNFKLTYVSPNHQEVMGLGYYHQEDVNTFDFVHPDDVEMVREECRKIFQLKTVQLPLYRYRNAAGEYRWYKTLLKNFLDDPDLQAIVSNTHDVTETKEAQEEINMLSQVAQETMDSVFILGADGKLLWVNKSFAQRKGLAASEMIGKAPMEIIIVEHEADRQMLQDHFRNRKVFHAEIQSRSKDEELRWLEVKGQPAYDDQGKFLYYFCIQTEITERKLKEETVLLSEEKYKLLFNQSSIAKYVFRRDDLRFKDVNEAALRLYGYSREEFLEMKLTDIRPEKEVGHLLQILDEYHSGEGRTFEGVMRHRKKDGTLMSVEINSNPFLLSDGMHYMVVANDITEKVRLQEQVLEEKIEAHKEKSKAIIQTQEKERSEIGKELHDNVNQILTTAKLYVQNVQYYPEQSDVFLAKGAELIQKSINEIRFLCKALVTPVINDIGFVATLQELIASYIELNAFRIEYDFDFNDSNIDKGVRLTIYRILQEQFNNTIKYANATEVVISLQEKGGMLEFVYQDNGVGFDPAERKSGLGLNNIRNRTEVYRGTLSIQTAKGKGCRMEILFPLDGSQI